MRMMVDHQFADSTSMGSSGLDELRWISPVRPGETLSARSEVLDATPHPRKEDRGVVKFRHTVVNQDGDVKMTIVSNVLFGKKPDGRGA